MDEIYIIIPTKINNLDNDKKNARISLMSSKPFSYHKKKQFLNFKT